MLPGVYLLAGPTKLNRSKDRGQTKYNSIPKFQENWQSLILLCHKKYFFTMVTNDVTPCVLGGIQNL